MMKSSVSFNSTIVLLLYFVLVSIIAIVLFRKFYIPDKQPKGKILLTIFAIIFISSCFLLFILKLFFPF